MTLALIWSWWRCDTILNRPKYNSTKNRTLKFIKNYDRILPVEDHIVPALWRLIKSIIDRRSMIAIMIVCFRRNIVSKSKDPILQQIFRQNDHLLSAIWPYVSNLKRSFTMSFFDSNLLFMFPIYVFCFQSHNDVSNVRFWFQSTVVQSTVSNLHCF